MYSRDEVIAVVLAFYQQIVKYPYLEEVALRSPPAGGWKFINVQSLKARGKNDTAVNLLRHLPYLCNTRDESCCWSYERLLMGSETAPICYPSISECKSGHRSSEPNTESLRSLAQGVDREENSLPMDTRRGEGCQSRGVLRKC